MKRGEIMHYSLDGVWIKLRISIHHFTALDFSSVFR